MQVQYTSAQMRIRDVLRIYIDAYAYGYFDIIVDIPHSYAYYKWKALKYMN